VQQRAIITRRTSIIAAPGPGSSPSCPTEAKTSPGTQGVPASFWGHQSRGVSRHCSAHKRTGCSSRKTHCHAHQRCDNVKYSLETERRVNRSATNICFFRRSSSRQAVFACIYICIHIHTHTQTYIHTYMHAYIHTSDMRAYR